MGITKKLICKPTTLDNKYIKDGLEAVSLLNEKEPYYLVGGMASQTYLPTFCRRPSSDLDFSIVRPLNYSDFKNVSKDMKQFLEEKGYEVNFCKLSRAYILEVIKGKDNQFCLEFSRRNKNSFNKHKKRLRREFSNSKNKILETRNCFYKVCAPEDIALPKLVRSINSYRRNPSFKKYIFGTKESFSKKKISDHFLNLEQMREKAMVFPSNLIFHEELRFASDLYDIRILSEIAGFNTFYLHKASLDWNTLRKDSKEREELIGSLLPFIARKF